MSYFADNKALLSLGADASSSGSLLGLPTDTLDDNDTTRWGGPAGSADDGYIQIDLGQTVTVTHFRIKQYANWTYDSTNATLEMSNDGTNWEVVAYLTLNVYDFNTQLPPHTARYWRLTSTAGGTNNWNIYTIELAGDVYVPPAGDCYQVLDALRDSQCYIDTHDWLDAHNEAPPDGFFVMYAALATLMLAVSEIQTTLAGMGGGLTPQDVQDIIDIHEGNVLANDNANYNKLTVTDTIHLDDVISQIADAAGDAISVAEGNILANDNANYNTLTDTNTIVLHDVKDAIDNKNVATPLDITNAVNTLTGEIEEGTAAVRGAPATDLATIKAELDLLENTDLTDVLTAIAGVVTTLEGDLTSLESSILDAIAGITFATGWPGLANVTTDPPVALSDHLVINQACDGVLVNITTPPTKVGIYAIGDNYYDYKEGEITFETDNGYMEMWQYLGFRQAVYVPKSMQTAAKVHFRVLAGAQGNVITWRRA